jgi:type II secretory pathway pseudopilin PulG
MRGRTDRGDTLIEIVITIVIVSLTVTALISSLATTGAAGQAQRVSALTDTVLRNYAEATKAAARTCTDGGTHYSPTYEPPTGFVSSATPSGGICPAVDTTELLTLAVTGPSGVTQTMEIVVRAP